MLPPVVPAHSPATLPDDISTQSTADAPTGPSWATVVVEGPRIGSDWVLQAPSIKFCRGGGRGFIPISCTASVNVNTDSYWEIENNVKVFTEHGVICRFKGIWPSLSKLHKWISHHWDPLITGTIHIYPMAKGFFVAKFENAKDKRKIRCESFFYEKDKMSLLAKLWHFDFNQLSKKFNKIPVWVRLPYLPLHLWVDSLFEEIGDAIGSFIMVDNESFKLYHTTFICILVELDVSKGLPTKIVINSSFGSWVQTLDYKGIPFTCCKCFKTGHAVGNCGLERKNTAASWWSRVSYQHYTVTKSLDSSNASLDAGASTLAGSDSLLAKNDSFVTTKDGFVIKNAGIQDVVVSFAKKWFVVSYPASCFTVC
ncbi:hypothetical protein SUGI_0373300 [Cryptomeria japonica]|nr:hypothetical protein SUGI_0373300 [Cryptomeria japonica]